METEKEKEFHVDDLDDVEDEADWSWLGSENRIYLIKYSQNILIIFPF